jgi:hypothetical protein
MFWAALGVPATTWALVAVAGRGGEELSPPFFTHGRVAVKGLRARLFHSSKNETSDAVGAVVVRRKSIVLPSKQQQ